MKRTSRLPLIVVLVCALLFTTTPRAEASIPTGTQIVLIFVAVGVIGAGIGVGVYYAVRKNPTITGCATSTPDGLTLTNESDNKPYKLLGDTAALKTGDRLRLQGKRKKDAAGAHTFLVDKLRKDFGVCKVTPATP